MRISEMSISRFQNFYFLMLSGRLYVLNGNF